MSTELQNWLESSITERSFTYSSYLLYLLHKSWPDNEIEFITANYTARGVSAIVKLKHDTYDNRNYAIEIYPVEEKDND